LPPFPTRRSSDLVLGAGALYLFLAKSFLGTAIRAIGQDRDIIGLMGVDQRRIYLLTSAIGGGLAGLAACLLVLQYDVHPFIGLSFGPITFMICVLGGLGNMIGGFAAAFIMSEIISIGGFYFSHEIGEVLAFVVFIALIFLRPQGIFGRSCARARHGSPASPSWQHVRGFLRPRLFR